MIHLICTLDPGRIPLLHQFSRHYAHLGVERFHFSLQVEPETDPATVDRSRSAANGILSAWGTQLSTVLMVPFTAQALREHHDRLQQEHCREDDWVVWTDIDEFQIYPGEFKALLRLPDTLGVDTESRRAQPDRNVSISPQQRRGPPSARERHPCHAWLTAHQR